MSVGLEERVAVIEERNRRVETDKAWETSWTRRGIIAAVTYVCAFILLSAMNSASAWQSAFVPVMGYVASTLSLPLAKAAWAGRRQRQAQG